MKIKCNQNNYNFNIFSFTLIDDALTSFKLFFISY
jgi:hypothetical protein